MSEVNSTEFKLTPLKLSEETSRKYLRATFLWLLALVVKESNSGVGEAPQENTDSGVCLRLVEGMECPNLKLFIFVMFKKEKKFLLKNLFYSLNKSVGSKGFFKVINST